MGYSLTRPIAVDCHAPGKETQQLHEHVCITQKRGSINYTCGTADHNIGIADNVFAESVLHGDKYGPDT